ncbi:MAG: hypothetical protein F3745_03380 [Nitrospinae bacterium]|nr:hypothetical protein [Nitrospinota bacterium]
MPQSEELMELKRKKRRGVTWSRNERARDYNSTLAVKTLNPGESTGYNRSGMVNKETPIAIVSIGYADGLMRMAGNGNYHMLVNGVSCPTIGNVCMDVCMLDISECETAKVGDEVIVFSKDAPIEALAKACNTISYEIISRIASRVKRVYTYQ